ncbi:MAG: hypothetical protein LBI26_02085 [Holosporales bacterium]|jgi:hypothetical protein|nr:hypothetical protein [Holosporales bacterium]
MKKSKIVGVIAALLVSFDYLQCLDSVNLNSSTSPVSEIVKYRSSAATIKIDGKALKTGASQYKKNILLDIIALKSTSQENDECPLSKGDILLFLGNDLSLCCVGESELNALVKKSVIAQSAAINCRKIGNIDNVTDSLNNMLGIGVHLDALDTIYRYVELQIIEH